MFRVIINDYGKQADKIYKQLQQINPNAKYKQAARMVLSSWRSCIFGALITGFTALFLGVYLSSRPLLIMGNLSALLAGIVCIIALRIEYGLKKRYSHDKKQIIEILPPKRRNPIPVRSIYNVNSR